MATYKIDSSLLTAQADEIRTLNGTTATMNPSQMTTALQSANAEVAEQEQKIIEITEMLQGKAMGGSGEDVTAEVTAQTELIADLESAVNALPEAGSGGGSGVETATVTVNSDFYMPSATYNCYYQTEDRYASVELPTGKASSISFQCIVPSMVAFYYGIGVLSASGDAELVHSKNVTCVAYVTGDATITISG